MRCIIAPSVLIPNGDFLALQWRVLRGGLRKFVNQLRAAGHTIADQDLARVSPLMHAHIIPNGAYRFADEEEPERMYAAAS
jgi:Tn3 transposase DDE domain